VRGRKPKPTALKLVTGNPGRRKLPTHEAKPTRVVPSPPAHLSEGALTAWGSLASRLDRLGLLTELDAMALEQLAENYAEIVALREDISANGRTQIVKTQTDTVERSRPQVSMLSDAERRFRGMMCEFGLTPSARSRVTATPDDARHTDPAEAYFG
jgi:P27 family predicted phage terminase small subunit